MRTRPMLQGGLVRIAALLTSHSRATMRSARNTAGVHGHKRVSAVVYRSEDQIMPRRLITATVGIVIFTVYASAIAVAEERYNLRPHFVVGQRWSDQRTNTFEMTTAVKANQQIMERHQQSSRNTLDLEWEVLALDGDTPTAARVTFGPNCGMQVQQDGQTQSVKFPAAGTTVTVRLLPGGEVEYQPASARTPEVEGVFETLFEVDAGAFPKQPIAVGESWSWDKAAIASSFDLGPDDEGSVTCTLKAVRTEQGREIGDIDFRIVMKQGQAQEGNGQRIATLTESNLSGQGQMDIAAGHMISLKLSGNMVTSGIVYAADEYGQLQPQADIEGAGKIELESRSRLVGGSSPSLPGAAPSLPGQVDFAGEYSGTEGALTLTLTLSRSADGFTGSIKMGERRIPGARVVHGQHASRTIPERRELVRFQRHAVGDDALLYHRWQDIHASEEGDGARQPARRRKEAGQSARW